VPRTHPSNTTAGTKYDSTEDDHGAEDHYGAEDCYGAEDRHGAENYCDAEKHLTGREIPPDCPPAAKLGTASSRSGGSPRCSLAVGRKERKIRKRVNRAGAD
jgi:hypothetical protein